MFVVVAGSYITLSRHHSLARGHKWCKNKTARASAVSGDQKSENGGVEGSGGLSETIEGHSQRRSLCLQVRLIMHLSPTTVRYPPPCFWAAARCHVFSRGAASRCAS